MIIIRPAWFAVLCFITGSIFTSSISFAQDYTRGIGIYPGDPKEDFSPEMCVDNSSYRNLALYKAAYHSSCVDYNLTAQLITDGIVDMEMPGWIMASTGKGPLPKNERQWLLDRHVMTSVTLDTCNGWIQFDIKGNAPVPVVDSLSVSGNLLVDDLEPGGWQISVAGSNDGQTWETVLSAAGEQLPGDTLIGPWRRFLPMNMRFYDLAAKLQDSIQYSAYRIRLNCPNAVSWRVSELFLLKDGKRVTIGGPYRFNSAWMSAGHKTEWVYVDLGAVCTFDQIKLFWIRQPSVGKVQVSDDAVNWKDIGDLHADAISIDDIVPDQSVKGRYVRVLMEKPATGDDYVLSEMQVLGRGGPVAVPKPALSLQDKGILNLAGGGWKLNRASEVRADGQNISQTGFNDRKWLTAAVPATILMSYVNAGAVPDPNFGDNQLMISESYFYSDFWYRNVFTAPAEYEGKRVWLNFDGINWKAEVYLNGKKLGRIEGAFTRGKFDVTGILLPGKQNALAVLIEKNDTPGFVKEQTKFSPDANGGEIGGDNPTFHASVGWDWIPTIRGRNTGIWNEVFLSTSDAVTIENPFVSADLPLPDTTSAKINIEVTLQNHTADKTDGVLKVNFGELTIEQPLSLSPAGKKVIVLNPDSHPALLLKNPKLWWPNGYGAPHLHDVKIEFITSAGVVSDTKSFKTGIREMAYAEENGILRIWINGRRFIGRGGNWGFPESTLRYRSREYDIAVRYHKDMNFTMIRNWVGQTGDEEFFEACDRHGIMVWQDFWLANPVDGPNPFDNDLFMSNARDFVLKIRNHPSIALYCGRNEGDPPDVLDNAIREVLPRIHPGIHYISNSAWGVVSGGGPYRAMPPEYYFKERATEKMHSEMGMPNIVTRESLNLMMPDSSFWPQERMWGIHDFCLGGAMRASSYNEMMDKAFGAIDNARDWVSLAQWINYQGYRAMFEAQGKNRMGLLLWMSHPAWPSMVWQTYDYYFEPTAAYFGCKKANEPLHIQWNPLTDSVEVINYHAGDYINLTASAELLNMDGSLQRDDDETLDSPGDSRTLCFKLKRPKKLSEVYFLRLKLKSKDSVLSENFYWLGKEEGNFQALHQLPKVKPEIKTEAVPKNGQWFLTVEISNPSASPLLMLRLKVVRENSGDRILPVIYSDNYINLMPGEKRIIKMELKNADTRGEKPALIVEGFNCAY